MKTIIVLFALMGVALALPAQPITPTGVPPPPAPGSKPVRVEKDDLKTDETVYIASAYSGLPAYSAYSAYGALPSAALPAYPAYSAYSALPAIQPIGAPIAYLAG